MWVAFLCLALCIGAGAHLRGEDTLARIEQDLLPLVVSMVGDSVVGRRLQACYEFIPRFARLLRNPATFTYAFDSLRKHIAIVSAPGGRFRLYSWEVLHPGGFYRHYGVIQLKVKDTVRLIPLIDHSQLVDTPERAVVCAPVWWGANYYNVVVRRRVPLVGRRYYFLFGVNYHNLRSNKKVVDVMYFVRRDSVCFGAPLFYFSRNDSVVYRFVLEYKEEAAVTLNYSALYRMILFDYLVPLNPIYEGKREWYVPEGTYDGFRWRWGRWHFVEHVF